MQNPGTRDFPVINLDFYNAYVQWPVDMPFYPERVRANAQGDHAKMEQVMMMEHDWTKKMTSLKWIQKSKSIKDS